MKLCSPRCRQHGALLIATLLALAALSLLAAAALEASALEQRMAQHSQSQQQLLADVEHVLTQVEHALVGAFVSDDQGWFAEAAEGQILSLSDETPTQYIVRLCCESPWNPALPVGPDNRAALYHIEVRMQAQISLGLQSVYLIAPATEARPFRSKRIAWRRVSP